MWVGVSRTPGLECLAGRVALNFVVARHSHVRDLQNSNQYKSALINS